MIFREMPPTWDPAFRPGFYARWGKESSVISALARRVEYPPYAQLLSIKMASGGEEHYFVDDRRLVVDDDTFLILNAGRKYGSLIEALGPTHSFSIFFRTGLAEEVLDSLQRSTDSLLSDPAIRSTGTVEFGEHLREHDRVVTPVLRFIRSAVDSGTSEPGWLEEQLHFLVGRMLKTEHARQRLQELVPAAKAATRYEVMRRLDRAVTFIHCRYREPISLQHMAAAAHMSPYHFLRTFHAVRGMTPSHFLNRKRTQMAVRLIRSTRWTLTEIAEHVGFGSRTTLFRGLKTHAGVPVGDLRQLDTARAKA
jgi:AraC family transcriptional regulator